MPKRKGDGSLLTPEERANRLMTLPEAAEYCGVTERWLKENTYKRRIPHYRPNGSNIIRYRRAELDEMIATWGVPAQIPVQPPRGRRGRRGR